MQLSQEADRLRRDLSEQDASSILGERPKEGADRLQERDEATQQSQLSPFGYEVRRKQSDAMLLTYQFCPPHSDISASRMDTRRIDMIY